MPVLLVMQCAVCGIKIALEPDEIAPKDQMLCLFCGAAFMTEKGWYHDLKPGSHPEVPHE